MAAGFSFPFADRSFHIIYLYSVFTHMRFQDARVYLMEFRRILKPSGHVFLTAFTEEGVPRETVNPPDYAIMTWRGPLHCVRWNQSAFVELVNESGFRVARIERGANQDAQTGYYLRPRADDGDLETDSHVPAS